MLGVKSSLINNTIKPVKRLAIIGGGIAGLTLAQLLKHQKSTLEVTIYERDRDSNAREQVSNILLHPSVNN